MKYFFLFRTRLHKYIYSNTTFKKKMEFFEIGYLPDITYHKSGLEMYYYVCNHVLSDLKKCKRTMILEPCLPLTNKTELQVHILMDWQFKNTCIALIMAIRKGIINQYVAKNILLMLCLVPQPENHPVKNIWPLCTSANNRVSPLMVWKRRLPQTVSKETLFGHSNVCCSYNNINNKAKKRNRTRRTTQQW